MNDVEVQVRKLMVELFDIEAGRVVAAARIREELGADSLDIVELIIALSTHFALHVLDAEVQKIRTVGDVTAYIEQKLVLNQVAPVRRSRPLRQTTEVLIPV